MTPSGVVFYNDAAFFFFKDITKWHSNKLQQKNWD